MKQVLTLTLQVDLAKVSKDKNMEKRLIEIMNNKTPVKLHTLFDLSNFEGYITELGISGNGSGENYSDVEIKILDENVF